MTGERKSRWNPGKWSKSAVRPGLFALLLAFSCFLAACGGQGPEAKETLFAEGFPVRVEDISLTLSEGSWREEVSPPEPSGYYSYYEKREGYWYYVMEGTVENQRQEPFFPSSWELLLAQEGEEREARLVLLNENKSNFAESLAPGESCSCYVLSLLEEKRGPESLEIFYGREPGEEGSKKKEAFPWELRIALP